MRNLLITSEAVVKSALIREESRGAHTREDFPGEREEGYLYNTIIYKDEDDNMCIKKEERKQPDEELKRIAESTLSELEKEVKKERE